jgi:hypothetical protein
MTFSIFFQAAVVTATTLNVAIDGSKFKAVNIRAIVADWVGSLRQEKLWGLDDPLFPATKVEVGESLRFEAAGLYHKHWSSAGPNAAEARGVRAGLPSLLIRIPAWPIGTSGIADFAYCLHEPKTAVGDRYRHRKILRFDSALLPSRLSGMVYLRHSNLPVAASRPATQSRTPLSPPDAPIMSLSLMASGAPVMRNSGWPSETLVSHAILPLSLSVATMRAGQLAGEMTRLPQKAAPRLVACFSCLGSIRQTIRPVSPEVPSIL